MPRMRFFPGLVLGLLLGVLTGAIGVSLVLPPRGDDGSATALQVQQLTRQVESTQRDKDALTRQVEDFRSLAERMATSFSQLERRFTALDEELRARDVREARATQAPPRVEQPADTPPRNEEDPAPF